MAKPNRRIVQRRPDGKTKVRALHANRASAIVETQADGIRRAREIRAKDGGGEMLVRGLDGQIRQQDTIVPGNDPRPSKG